MASETFSLCFISLSYSRGSWHCRHKLRVADSPRQLGQRSSVHCLCIHVGSPKSCVVPLHPELFIFEAAGRCCERGVQSSAGIIFNTLCLEGNSEFHLIRAAFSIPNVSAYIAWSPCHFLYLPIHFHSPLLAASQNAQFGAKMLWQAMHCAWSAGGPSSIPHSCELSLLLVPHLLHSVKSTF